VGERAEHCNAVTGNQILSEEPPDFAPTGDRYFGWPLGVALVYGQVKHPYVLT